MCLQDILAGGHCWDRGEEEVCACVQSLSLSCKYLTTVEIYSRGVFFCKF